MMFHMRPATASFCLTVALWTCLLAPMRCEAEEAAAKDVETDQNNENDPTKDLLKELTIGMMEVVDERTVLLRPTSSKDKKIVQLRLGNVGPPVRGSLSDEEYAEKVAAAKAALAKLVDKQALWYKAAPESVQSLSGSPDVVIADLWNKGGSHVNSAMKKEGHLSEVQEYESDIARDILGAAAREEKEASYKKLGDVMAEHEKEKQAAAKAAREKAKKEDADDFVPESFGVAGWIGVGLLVALGIGVATNFGQGSNKKSNMNRKKGVFEKMWMKLKGA